LLKRVSTAGMCVHSGTPEAVTIKSHVVTVPVHVIPEILRVAFCYVVLKA
jgi:hypothetical protein